ncbi:MAG: UMP kinase [Candidatus Krumholzibacteriota bacterium]
MNKIDRKRILLKLSGELFGSGSVDPDRVYGFAEELAAAINGEAEIAVVVGGGNILRGGAYSEKGYDRGSCDYMGMIATVINAQALKIALDRLEVPAVVMTAFSVRGVGEEFDPFRARECLERGSVLILAGGTGNPYFTTDTAAALRAAQIGADVIYKGTKVDGVYDSDPVKNENARKFDFLTYTEVLTNDLKVMDSMAVAFCRENSIPVFVFNIIREGNLEKAVQGNAPGTLIKGGADGIC